MNAIAALLGVTVCLAAAVPVTGSDQQRICAEIQKLGGIVEQNKNVADIERQSGMDDPGNGGDGQTGTIGHVVRRRSDRACPVTRERIGRPFSRLSCQAPWSLTPPSHTLRA